MERLNRSVFIFVGLMLVIAAVAHLAPKPVKVSMTEDQLRDLCPSSIGGQHYIQELKSGDDIYQVLKPFGIIERVFDYEGDNFDAVVIASNSKDSFHDPNICFSAQGWTIESRRQIQIPTQSRGTVSAMLISMYDINVQRKYACYLYQGPGGFYGDTNRLKLAFLAEAMKLGDRYDGVFYRFIPTFADSELTPKEQEERLVNFIGKFMDAANESSNGYL